MVGNITPPPVPLPLPLLNLDIPPPPPPTTMPTVTILLWCITGPFDLICIVFTFFLVYSWIQKRRQAARNKEMLPSEAIEKLAPKVIGNQLVMGTECAICLDQIESEQFARLIHGCNHGFHLECADAWFSEHLVCPICRAELRVDPFSPAAAAEENC